MFSQLHLFFHIYYLVFYCKKQLFFLPICISRDAWILLYSMDYNPLLLFILMLRLSQIWPVGTSLSRLLCNWVNPHHSLTIFFTEDAGLILYFPYPRSRISPFSKELCVGCIFKTLVLDSGCKASIFLTSGW